MAVSAGPIPSAPLQAAAAHSVPDPRLLLANDTLYLRLDSLTGASQPKAKAPKEEGEQKSALAAQLKDTDVVFGVCHLFGSFNDTFVVSLLPFSAILHHH